MLAKDVMVREVITINDGATVGELLKLLAEHHIGAVPVVNDRRQVVGIVTDGDIMSRIRANRPVFIDLLTEIFILEDNTGLQEKVRGLVETPVREVMTRRVITVQPDTPIDEVAGLLTDHRIKKVPVVENGVLKGIISRGDIVRAVARQAGGQAHP